jgi:hypothetical protein
MWCQWVLWCNTNQARTAARSTTWAIDSIGRPFKACLYQYDIDIPGIRASFYTKSGKHTRDDCIIEAITLCERLGSEWVLEGSIRRSLSLFSQHIRKSGIVGCECYPMQREIGKRREDIGLTASKTSGRSVPMVLPDAGGWKGEMKFGDVVLVWTRAGGLSWCEGRYD